MEINFQPFKMQNEFNLNYRIQIVIETLEMITKGCQTPNILNKKKLTGVQNVKYTSNQPYVNLILNTNFWL